MTSNLGTATPGVTFTLLCESGSLRVLADSAHSSPPWGGPAGGHLSGSACSFRGGRSSGGHADLGLCALSHTLLTGRLPVGRDSVALAPGCPHTWKYPTQAQHSEQTCEPASLHGDTPEPRGHRLLQWSKSRASRLDQDADSFRLSRPSRYAVLRCCVCDTRQARPPLPRSSGVTCRMMSYSRMRSCGRGARLLSSSGCCCSRALCRPLAMFSFRLMAVDSLM